MNQDQPPATFDLDVFYDNLLMLVAEVIVKFNFPFIKLPKADNFVQAQKNFAKYIGTQSRKAGKDINLITDILAHLSFFCMNTKDEFNFIEKRKNSHIEVLEHRKGFAIITTNIVTSYFDRPPENKAFHKLKAEVVEEVFNALWTPDLNPDDIDQIRQLLDRLEMAP